MSCIAFSLGEEVEEYETVNSNSDLDLTSNVVSAIFAVGGIPGGRRRR